MAGAASAGGRSGAAARRRGLLSRLALVAVTDGDRCVGDPVAACAAAVRGGATAVLLRDRHLPPARRKTLARALRKVTADGGALLLVHSDPDLARAVGAEGVHGADGGDVAALRRACGDDLLLGVSVHHPEGAAAAARGGADWALFGSLWTTRSHPGRPPAGVAPWRRAAAAARAAARGRPFPVGGIGGVTAARVAAVRGALPGPVAAVDGLLTGDPGDGAALLAALADHGVPGMGRIGDGSRGPRPGSGADERSLVAAFLADLGRDRPPLLLGPGDDAAVLDLDGTPLAAATDVTVAGVHYDSRATARAAGRKAVGRALSDLAAVGARPRWVLLGLTLPRGTSRRRATELFRGAAEGARAAGARLVAGDTKETPGVETLAVTALGSVEGGGPLPRGGGSPGEWLLVTGRLGGSLRRGRHLRPRPRWRAGEILRRRGLATACIDLSDGLVPDLRRLCAASRCGAVLDLARLPVHGDARRGSGDPVEGALFDGEDFELLFSAPPAVARRLLARGLAGEPVFAPGRLLPEAAGLVLLQGDGAARRPRGTGWIHLRPEPR